MQLMQLIFIAVDVRLVGMTATVGNLEELSKFVQGNIYRGDFRPVELKVSCSLLFLSLCEGKGSTSASDFILIF
jgi:replicative superfamily II helicase